MAKEVDTNSFWYIKHNPISKVGVFPYYGRNISEDCEPDKIYNVLRPAETLRESVSTWDNPPKPFIEDHEMLGEGFSKVDDRPVQGIICNPVFDEKTGVLYADLAIYSEDMKEKIANGKKEISLGYFCKYEKKRGVFDGVVYDFVQTNMVGNHGALVDAGRCGSDVKVFDHKCTMDSIDINPTDFMAKDAGEENLLNKNQENEKITIKNELNNTTRSTNMAKYVLLEDVKAILKKGLQWDDKETPTQKLIFELLDEKAVDGITTTTTTDADDEEKEKACGDEDAENAEKEENKEDKTVMDAIKELTKCVRGVKKALDEMAEAKKEEEKKAEDEDGEENKKSDGAEDEDADEEKKTEDEDGEENGETKKAEDSAAFVLNRNGAQITQDAANDPALQKYLS